MAKSNAFGIDLGTTYSCVGIYENGKVEIIANGRGERTTPSMVGFYEDQRTVGYNAKKKMSKYPLQVVSCAKRLIGRKFDDPKVQEVIKDVPYKIVASENGNAAFQVEFRGETVVYMPEEISARVLVEMKKIAVNYLGGKCNDTFEAVITIPAYFNDAQRQATIDAAKIAKIDVLRLINEPTAAALAYANKEKWKNGIILVYDLGGGTLDVSLIKVTDGCCEVLAVSGNDHLGGEDFDYLIVKHCIGEFQRVHHQDVSNDARAISLLKSKCEEAKRRLSNSKFAPIEIDKLCDGKDLSCKITQEEFNELCKDLVEKTLQPVINVLKEAKLTKEDVNNVVLVGGSTRIPFVQKTLTEFFDNKKLNFDINPDEAVANGAAILAAHLSKSFDTSIQNIRLLDVIPRSLGDHLYTGKDDDTGYFRVVIPRYTKFPCEVSKVSYTLEDNVEYMEYDIYEGDDRLVQNNKFLGTFTLTNITPSPAKDVSFKDTFKIDENGILTVTATESSKGNTNSLTILQDKGRLTDDELVRMIDEVYPPIMEIDLDSD